MGTQPWEGALCAPVTGAITFLLPLRWENQDSCQVGGAALSPADTAFPLLGGGGCSQASGGPGRDFPKPDCQLKHPLLVRAGGSSWPGPEAPGGEESSLADAAF